MSDRAGDLKLVLYLVLRRENALMANQRSYCKDVRIQAIWTGSMIFQRVVILEGWRVDCGRDLS